MLYEPADIIIHIQGRGIVLKDKSVLAYQKSDNKIVAFGTEAECMANGNPENILVTSPLRQGKIADYHAAAALFSHMLTIAIGKRPLLKPVVALCVPKEITLVEKKAFEEVLIGIAARESFITDIPAETFIKEFPAGCPEESRKCKIAIGIVKEEPERYVSEQLKAVLSYAAQMHIPQERICELLQNLNAIQ